jgi:hypothetical protein
MKTESQRGRRDRSQTSQAQLLEEKKWRYICRPFGTNSLKEGVMCCIDPLLSSDSVNSDRFWATAR